MLSADIPSADASSILRQYSSPAIYAPCNCSFVIFVAVNRCSSGAHAHYVIGTKRKFCFSTHTILIFQLEYILGGHKYPLLFSLVVFVIVVDHNWYTHRRKKGYSLELCVCVYKIGLSVNWELWGESEKSHWPLKIKNKFYTKRIL